MSPPLTDRERALARAWQKAANDLDIGAMEMMRVVTMLLSAMLFRVSVTKDDALEGIAALSRDLTRQADQKFPIDLDRRTPDSPWEKP